MRLVLCVTVYAARAATRLSRFATPYIALSVAQRPLSAHPASSFALLWARGGVLASRVVYRVRNLALEEVLN
jgi:hypothetical protein